ncbi:MAG: NAD-dependent epimerase/dehydratase family protein [Cytophagaceae bacterium]|nr:NAD-dependent epimerase/dehydratase family protein [Cytophagaceae bacterium]MDW8456382.1 NAD-dependent epimerase/dehydratase family protein [Cytophagaceae bacterium]
MNVLVTGGAGYIGAELVYRLSQKEDVASITVYDNLSRENYNFFTSLSHKMTNGKVRFVQGELLDSRKLRKVLKDIDVVYHLAAKVSRPFANVDSHSYEQINHWGTAELVYAIEDTPSVKRLIYTSCASIYGKSKNEVDESTPVNPTHHYSISKWRGEDHVLRIKNKINTYVLRLAKVYGFSPCIRFDSVINRFMFDAHFNKRIQIHGSGKQIRPFIHIQKVVDVLLEMRLTKAPSDIYNLSDKNIEVLDLVEILKELYPDMEYIFINQHLEMSDLIIKPELKISKYFPIPQSDLKDEMKEFKERFAFS